MQLTFFSSDWICASLGFIEFHRLDWVIGVLQWQNPTLGCWAETLDGKMIHQKVPSSRHLMKDVQLSESELGIVLK